MAGSAAAVLEPESGFRRAGSGASFLRLNPKRVVTRRKRQRGHATTARPPSASGRRCCQKTCQATCVRSSAASSRLKGQTSSERVVCRNWPTSAPPRPQQSQEHHELQGRDELPRGGKLAFFAGLFEAPLGGLLGFAARSAIGVHIPNIRCAAVQACPAELAQDAREQRRHPAQHQQRGQHLGREGQGQQLQLRVQPAQQRQRDIHHHQQRHHRQRQPHAGRKQPGASRISASRRGAPKHVCARPGSVPGCARTAAGPRGPGPGRKTACPAISCANTSRMPESASVFGIDGGGVGVSGLHTRAPAPPA